MLEVSPMRRRSFAAYLLPVLAVTFIGSTSIACDADNDDDDDDRAPASPAGSSGSSGSNGSSGTNGPAPSTVEKKLSFDESTQSPLTAALGEWVVEADPSAPSGPNVLRQKSKLAGSAFPLAFVPGLDLADMTVRVRCKPEAGAEDQACGLSFRLKDKDNYFLTRANALEGNVRFYKVVAGVRSQLASAERKVTANEWHTLEAKAFGTKITVSWDGEALIDATDATFARGSAGVWTKADSITAFDDFVVTGRP
jgi:hypothetical protein